MFAGEMERCTARKIAHKKHTHRPGTDNGEVATLFVFLHTGHRNLLEAWILKFTARLREPSTKEPFGSPPS